MESWDEESANKYMELLQTAIVLEQIHDQFPGKVFHLAVI